MIRHGRVEAIHGYEVMDGQYTGESILFKIGIPDDPHTGHLIFGGFIFDWGWHKDAGMQALAALVDLINMRTGSRHYEDTINTRSTSGPAGTNPSWSTSGITGAPGQEGTMVFSRIQTGGWPDNGLYVKGGDGRKIVTNCVAVNSNVANIRTNGGDA
ncbi:hypothetical protein [Halegenticoccus soli]|uniref:hypothetical protein n=1 Tax=Halegenticoccus soli TaxID=1985678 RepID=UPI000C6EA2C1|nr:hypothetical protein [Halegenticoccus soli]